MRQFSLSSFILVGSTVVAMCLHAPALHAQYTWTEIGPPDFIIKDVFYGDGIFYLVSESPEPALAISADQGETWEFPAMTNGPGPGMMELSVGSGYQGSVHIFGWSGQSYLWCSSDGGASFSIPGGGWLSSDLHLKGFHRSGFNDHLYTYGSTFASAYIGGPCPSFSEDDSGYDVRDVAVKWDTLFAVTPTGQVITTASVGSGTWADVSPTNVGLGGVGAGIALGSGVDQGGVWRLFAAGDGDGIIRSHDAGATWEAANTGITTTGPFVDVAATYWSMNMLAVQQEHAYVSADGGDTYVAADAGLDFGTGIIGAGCGFWDGLLYAYTSEKLYAVDISLGTTQHDRATQALYPQPTTGLVRLPLSSSQLLVEVLDGAGRPVSRIHSSADGMLDLSHLPPGCYMLRFPGPTGAQPQRVVIAR